MKSLAFYIILVISVLTLGSCKNKVESKSTIMTDTTDTLQVLSTDSLLKDSSIIQNEAKVNSEEVDSLEFDGLEKVIRLTEGINNPKSVVISPNGRYAYINNLEGMNTMIINTETYETESIIEHTGKPVEFGITGKGRYVWISYFRLLEKGYPRELGVERNYRYSSVVVVYDTLEKALTKRIDVGIIPKVIAVSPDEKLVLVANWNSGTLTAINAENYEVIKTIKVGLIPRGVEFTPDGKYVYVCNFGGSTISVIDALTLEEIKIIKNVGYKPRDIIIRNDQSYAYFSTFGDGYLMKLDLESDVVVDKIRIGSQPRSICMTHNNNYIFAVNYASASISVIDSRTFSKIGTYQADLGAVGVALTPDMKYLWVTNQSTGSIIVYKIKYKNND